MLPFGKHGNGQAVLGIVDDSGNVGVFGKDGKPRVVLSVSEVGGSVAAYMEGVANHKQLWAPTCTAKEELLSLVKMESLRRC